MEKQLIKAIQSVEPDLPVYHDYAPEEAVLPLAIIRREGGAGHLFLEQGQEGYSVRFYVSVWAGSRLEAVRLSHALEAAVCDLPSAFAMGAAEALFDPETGKRGMGQDFVLTGNRK